MEHNLLILGASSDLALSLIPRVAPNYHVIFAHYCNSKDQLVELQKKVPCELKLLQADFTKEEDTKQLIQNLQEDGREITHLLHCPSARAVNIRFTDLKWETYEQMMNVQVRSLYQILQWLLPSMVKKKYGKIVNVLTSYTIGTPPAYLNDYVTAKYALLGFIKALAVEYASKNIQINAVSPSMIETKFLTDIPELIVQHSAQKHPLKRNASVDDVLPALEFLLSEGSRFITGQNLLVSGGSII